MGKIENLAERISKSRIFMYEEGNSFSEDIQALAKPAWELAIYVCIFGGTCFALDGAYKGIKYLIN